MAQAPTDPEPAVPTPPVDPRATTALLRAALEEAVGLLDADGGLVYLPDEDGRHLHLLEDASLMGDGAREVARGLRLPVGAGLFGTAYAERRLTETGDYTRDRTFPHDARADAVVDAAGITSMVVAPLVAGASILGALGVFCGRRQAFGDRDRALVRALATHAATTLANMTLIAELERSEALLVRRSQRERTLRELVGSLAAIRDTDVLLEHVVEAAVTVTGADGAFLDRIDHAGRMHTAYSRNVTSQTARAILRQIELQPPAGVMGRAVTERQVVRTDDYLADVSFLHAPDSDALVAELGLRSLVAAPLIADGELLGVLATYSPDVAAFDDESTALVATFADHAAIAIANAHLIEALDRSESRSRGMLAASPDIIFELDAEGRFTYLSDTLERQLGWTVAEMVGQHFGALIDASSMTDATERWAFLRSSPGVVVDARLLVVARDGRRIPYEIRSFGMERDGRFVGVQGAARDVSERQRLERELRDSEERYRYLVKASPDVVWAIDEEGQFTFLSDRLQPLTGFGPEELLGHHFRDLTDPASMPAALEAWAAVQRDPSAVHQLSLLLIRSDGPSIPVDVWLTGLVREGAFAGAHGSIRDVRDRERLERELRESEARYRYLVDNSPDIVWTADADGIITYMSETSEAVLGWRPDEIVGQPFSTVIHPDSLDFVRGEYEFSRALTEPRDLRYRFDGRHRDGARVALEMHAKTIVEDGRYQGVHGAVRDIRARERLERDLRRQAAELAAGEERAHLARELHDSVTQALFSMTLVTRSIDLLLDRDPAAARTRLETLAELQKDALAEMRALIFELRPASLETEGLVRALRTHCAAVEGRAGLGIVIEADEEAWEQRLPAELESALFRIAQEALNNVVKHAAATHVHIGLERTERLARLEVADDGVGFDPARIPDGHLGVAGMRARTEKLGGRFGLESAVGRGTRIEAAIPLPPERTEGPA
jgi:PAS domain S-box-containing protein